MRKEHELDKEKVMEVKKLIFEFKEELEIIHKVKETPNYKAVVLPVQGLTNIMTVSQ